MNPTGSRAYFAERFKPQQSTSISVAVRVATDYPGWRGDMKTDVFAALLESTEEALARASGKRQLRTTVLPGAPKAIGADDVRALREQLNASQAVFAHYLNVSTKLVQAWESSRRRPDGAALRLLEIAERDPRVVFHGLWHVDASTCPSEQSAGITTRSKPTTRASRGDSTQATRAKRKRASA
jgi:putative transcriptional regulator